VAIVPKPSTSSKGECAAIYSRVSTSKQEDGGTSLATQEAACRAYVAARGDVVDPAHVYIEVHTGVELWQRPALTRLREAIRRHELDVVVVYAIDRLSRDPVHLGVLLTEAEQHHVRVEFVTEPLDDSPEGQLIRFVRGYAAKVEHEKIREHSTRARHAIVVSGKLGSSPKPLYGYQWIDEETPNGPRHVSYEPDPLTAPIVVRIFTMIGEGKSTWMIAATLTREGIPSPGGTAWPHIAIQRILTNEAYIGQKAAWSTRGAKNAETGKKGKVARDPSE
jgi:site-specific DNA recombinase